MLIAWLLLTAAPPPDLTALGVVVSPRPGGSVALLRSEGRTRAVAVGESAFGGRVTGVTSGSIVLDYDGQKVELRLPEPAAGPPPPPPAPATHAQGRGEAAVEPAPHPRALSREEVQRRLALEIPRILAETAVAPVTSEGQVQGMALTRMPSGTLLSEVGLQAGDVITELNGTRVDSLGTLLGLWGRLQGASDLSAVVLRNGQPVSLSLTLR